MLKLIEKQKNHSVNGTYSPSVFDNCQCCTACDQSISMAVFVYTLESEVAQSFPTLCDPMNWGLPGSSIHGIFQARVLEWVAVAFSSSLSRELFTQTSMETIN